MSIEFTSPGFINGGMIPKDYTCEGADRSPALAWSGLPSSVKSLALIVDDPDAPAGTWVHWVVYNMPANLQGLPEGVPSNSEVVGVGMQGKNDFRRLGYGGPCPPKGKPHRYFFKLYALDTILNIASCASKADLEKAMKGHILGQGQLIGLYERK